MKDFTYSIYNPGGNITALVVSELEASLDIAESILAKHSAVEQVGFILGPRLPGTTFHLQMTGGEFCVNAARSAAFAFMKDTGLNSITFTVSGYSHSIEAYLVGTSVTISIPSNIVTRYIHADEFDIIDFQGIRFLVTTHASLLPVKEKLIGQYAEDFLAVGFLFIEDARAGCVIHPWVWVRIHNTLIAETACGSGSIATALFFQEHGVKKEEYAIIQPSGSIYHVILDTIGNTMILSGPVTLYLD